MKYLLLILVTANIFSQEWLIKNDTPLGNFGSKIFKIKDTLYFIENYSIKSFDESGKWNEVLIPEDVYKVLLEASIIESSNANIYATVLNKIYKISLDLKSLTLISEFEKQSDSRNDFNSLVISNTNLLVTRSDSSKTGYFANRLFFSSDDGSRWDLIESHYSNHSDEYQSPGAVFYNGKITYSLEIIDSILYINESMDHGRTWAVFDSLSSEDVYYKTIDSYYFNSELILIGMSNGKIIKYSNKDWKTEDTPLNSIENIFRINDQIVISKNEDIYIKDEEYDNWLSIENKSPIQNIFLINNNIYCNSFRGIFRLDRNNKKLIRINELSNNINIIDHYIDVEDIYLVSADGDVFNSKSFDFINTKIDTLISSNEIEDIIVIDSLIVIGEEFALQGNYKWTIYNKNTGVVNDNIAISHANSMIKYKNGLLYSSNGAIYKMDLLNFSKNEITTPLNDDVINNIKDIFLNEKDDIFIFTSNKGVFVSRDDLNSLDYLKPLISDSSLISKPVTSIYINKNVMMLIWDFKHVYFSKDYGQNWNLVPTNFDDPITKGILYEDYIVLFTFQSPKYNWVYTRSLNNENWYDQKIDINYYSSHRILNIWDIFEHNNNIYIGANGLYKVDLNSLKATDLKLEENYDYLYISTPYPQPSTNKIHIDLKWLSHRKLLIEDINLYDINGNMVDYDQNIKLNYTGNYQGTLDLDTSKLQTGIYLVIITYGETIKSIKVLKY